MRLSMRRPSDARLYPVKSKPRFRFRNRSSSSKSPSPVACSSTDASSTASSSAIDDPILLDAADEPVQRLQQVDTIGQALRDATCGVRVSARLRALREPRLHGDVVLDDPRRSPERLLQLL